MSALPTPMTIMAIGGANSRTQHSTSAPPDIYPANYRFVKVNLNVDPGKTSIFRIQGIQVHLNGFAKH